MTPCYRGAQALKLRMPEDGNSCPSPLRYSAFGGYFDPVEGASSPRRGSEALGHHGLEADRRWGRLRWVHGRTSQGSRHHAWMPCLGSGGNVHVG